MNKEKGGPAFPMPTHKKKYGPGIAPLVIDAEYGMTLRDYFAAKAMQAMIPLTTEALAAKLFTSETVCGACYEWADAMLKARDA
jgi:hypothetical protein